MVKCVLPKHNSRVRFPLPAPKVYYADQFNLDIILIETDRYKEMFKPEYLKEQTAEGDIEQQVKTEIKFYVATWQYCD